MPHKAHEVSPIQHIEPSDSDGNGRTFVVFLSGFFQAKVFAPSEIKRSHARTLQAIASHASRRYQDAIESFKLVVQTEPAHVYANHALGTMYLITGNKTSAMQQYYILKNLNEDAAADLLRAISK